MEQQNIIVVTDETGKEIKIDLLFEFEIKEFRKHYAVYTIGEEIENELMTVVISEYDNFTNKIKDIEPDEIETVKNVYDELKENIIQNES